MSLIKVVESFNILKKTPIGDSPYFTWHEALYLQKIAGYANPTVEQMMNIMSVCKTMDKIRVHFNTPITINSWLRPDFYNKVIGGATFSHHRTGSAVDFNVLGLNADYVRAELRAHPELYDKCSFETGITWVHIQNDGRGMWFPEPPKKGA